MIRIKGDGTKSQQNPILHISSTGISEDGKLTVSERLSKLQSTFPLPFVASGGPPSDRRQCKPANVYLGQAVRVWEGGREGGQLGMK